MHLLFPTMGGEHSRALRVCNSSISAGLAILFEFQCATKAKQQPQTWIRRTSSQEGLSVDMTQPPKVPGSPALVRPCRTRIGNKVKPTVALL